MFDLYFENERAEEVVPYMLRALDDIKEEVRAGYEGNIYDLHDVVFNSGFYVIGRYKAKKELENNLDIFEVIRSIIQYENDNFGEVLTDVSEPEKVLNMFYYLVGERCINMINNNSGLEWDEVENEKDRNLILDQIEIMKKNLNK